MVVYDPGRLDLLLRHMPGKHDQSTHGRGKGGVRESLAQAASTAELNSAAAAEAKAITGRDTVFDMAGTDLEIGKEHVEGMLQGMERFPDVHIGLVTTYGPGARTSEVNRDLDDNFSEAAAVTRSHGAFENGIFRTTSNIYFNNRVAGLDPPAYREALANRPSHEGQIPKTPRDVALHEFGHAVAGHVGGNINRKVYDDAVGHAETAGATPHAFIVRHVSAYASSAMGEYTAETFADVMINGHQASDLSKSAFAILEAGYGSRA